MPERRDGAGGWAPIVVEWWNASARSAAARSVWDDWAWLQLEVAAYHFQMWWDLVEAGKSAEAVRAYAELRQQASSLYLPPPDRIRGEREGSIPDVAPEQPAVRRSAASRARLRAVDGA